MATEPKGVVLITGGSGLIGMALGRRLSERYRVVGLDQRAPQHAVPGTAFIPVDISSEASIRAALEQVRTEYGGNLASVIHLAAYYSFSGEPTDKYDTVTVQGTRSLLSVLRTFSVEQFIFSSTMLVHAPAEPGREIDERSPLDPRWDYPESKLRAEAAIQREHGGMPVLNLRIAGVYDDGGHSVPLAQHIKRVYERQLTSHFLPGDPSHGQAFIHLDDLVEVVERAIERRHTLPPETTLLVGEDVPLSFNALQEEIGRLVHGKAWRTLPISERVAALGAWAQQKAPLTEEPFIKPWMIPFADDHYDLDISRARALLDWTPRHSLRATLPKMVAALKQDPSRWYRENKLEPPGLIERLWIAAKARPLLAGLVAAAVSTSVVAAWRRISHPRRSRWTLRPA